jgi:hypothetical protein
MNNPPRSSGSSQELAALSVAFTTVEFPLDATKWESFLAAAELIGRTPERLLAECIDLCMDTAIAMAMHMHDDDQ